MECPTQYRQFLFCRMVHAFTSTGLTETQYHSFGEAAGIGSVMDKTIDTSGYFSYISNYLITESEVVTRKSQTEALPY